MRPDPDNARTFDFDYDSLFVLSAVRRTGSFDAAARSLKVTQSAVSQRIKQLEERVGAILIVRGRPCVPTEEGLLLIEHAEQVSLLQKELARRMHRQDEATNQQPVTLRVAVNMDSVATWFPAVVQRAADEANLRLAIVADDQDYTDEHLRSGEALGVVTTREQPIPGCDRIALGTMSYMAVATPAFIERFFEAGVTSQALARATTLLFDQRDTLPRQWTVKAFGRAVDLDAHQVPSYEGHLRCCLLGAGWAMMPRVTASPLIASGALAELVSGQEVGVSLHWQARSQASELMQQLSAIIVEEAGAAFRL